MPVALNIQKKDFLDHTSDFFTASPRDFWRAGHELFFWTKYLTGKDSSILKSGVAVFSKAFDSFNVVDLAGNLKSLRNHFNGKESKDISLLVSDTLNSGFETISWLAGSVLSISSKILSFAMFGSGATLMYSSAKNVYNDINNLVKKPLNDADKNIKLLKIATDISLFAIGVLLVLGGLGYSLITPLLSAFGLVILISNLAKYIIEHKQPVIEGEKPALKAAKT